MKPTRLALAAAVLAVSIAACDITRVSAPDRRPGIHLRGDGQSGTPTGTSTTTPSTTPPDTTGKSQVVGSGG